MTRIQHPATSTESRSTTRAAHPTHRPRSPDGAPAVPHPLRPPGRSGTIPPGLVVRRRPTIEGCGGGNAVASAQRTALSRTTDRVLEILLEGDLARLRADSVAECLGISCTTLRRRLRNDQTNYQFLLDRARQYRCEARLRERWLPGKCLADELGYLEVNSFYRAFRRWTGLSYSEYKQAQQ